MPIQQTPSKNKTPTQREKKKHSKHLETTIAGFHIKLPQNTKTIHKSSSQKIKKSSKNKNNTRNPLHKKLKNENDNVKLKTKHIQDGNRNDVNHKIDMHMDGCITYYVWIWIRIWLWLWIWIEEEGGSGS